MSNVLTRRDYITDNLETDLEESIHKYVQLLKDLEDYPEWQVKVRDDIGNYVHMLYTNI